MQGVEGVNGIWRENGEQGVHVDDKDDEGEEVEDEENAGGIVDDKNENAEKD